MFRFNGSQNNKVLVIVAYVMLAFGPPLLVLDQVYADTGCLSPDCWGPVPWAVLSALVGAGILAAAGTRGKGPLASLLSPRPDKSGKPVQLALKYVNLLDGTEYDEPAGAYYPRNSKARSEPLPEPLPPEITPQSPSPSPSPSASPSAPPSRQPVGHCYNCGRAFYRNDISKVFCPGCGAQRMLYRET